MSTLSDIDVPKSRYWSIFSALDGTEIRVFVCLHLCLVLCFVHLQAMIEYVEWVWVLVDMSMNVSLQLKMKTFEWWPEGLFEKREKIATMINSCRTQYLNWIGNDNQEKKWSGWISTVVSGRKWSDDDKLSFILSAFSLGTTNRKGDETDRHRQSISQFAR